ncbi:MAG TPA: hypothetical protein VJ742_09630 [Nitrososphaera sp.]|nr:hypothetical protein [Nitrososphaera sp.]
MRLRKKTMANIDGKDNAGEHKTITLRRVIMAAFVSTALLTSIVTSLGNGVQDAYAAKGGKSDDSSDRGKSAEKGKSKNSTSTSSSDKQHNSKHDGGNATDAKPNNGKKPSDIEEQNSILKKAEKLKQHGNETDVSLSYSTNGTFLMEANGTAKAIGANGSSSDAELSVEMSIWKTKKNMVSMDITEGSISVDGQAMEFYSGQAHYFPYGDKMLLTGFVVVDNSYGQSEPEGNDESADDNQTGTSNQTSTAINQTSSVNSNQTSTEDVGLNQTSTTPVTSGDETVESLVEEGPSLRHIKLWIKVTGEELLGTEGSEPENSIEILSPQSKIASQWFLEMTGELYHSSSS